MAKSNQNNNKRPARRKVRSVADDGGGLAHARRVEVTRIHTYERNPRHTRNPEYDRIKASIRACGMDQALRITRRPGETGYIVQAGGNTRLQVQQELYEATGEERFRWVDCLFVDWDRESAVLLAHLRENELRGNLSFIDRARAVVEIQALAADERGVEELSNRQLEQFLTEQGYYASRSLISVMDYAVSVLLPVLPRALDAGLGRPQVQRIRDLQRIGQAVWQLHGAGDDTEFDEVFTTLCRRHDHEDWVFDSLRQAVETEIAEAADVRIQRVRVEFDCRLGGSKPDIPAFVAEEDTDETHFPMAPRDEPNAVSAAEHQALAPSSRDATEAGSDDAASAELPASTEPAGSPPASHEIAVELPPGTDIDAVFRRVGAATKGHLPLALLRQTAFEMARHLARGHGLGSLVERLPDQGLGYRVCGLPHSAVIDQLDPQLRAEVRTLWWQLVVFADMASAPAAALDAGSSDDAGLAAAMREQDFTRLIEQVPPLDWARLGPDFWARLGHETWCTWLCLAHNYRELHRSARLTETPLWRAST